jgi:hypothetical protein
MKTEDYPALYQAADAASLGAQQTYLSCTKLYGGLTIVAAGLAAYGISSRTAAIAAAVLFLAGLFLSIYLAVKRLESTWYRARAIAESTKTATWRFMMRADPFDEPTLSAVRQDFSHLLTEILQQHKDLGAELGGDVATRDQLTSEMLATRELHWNARLESYVANRIEEQRRWYAAKSADNRRKSRIWFSIFIVLQGGAVFFTILRVGYPLLNLWTTEVLVVGAAIVLGWIQVKRYRELATAYGLTAQEIGLAKADSFGVGSEQELADFVVQTENAFSREHTQWAARKD